MILLFGVLSLIYWISPCFTLWILSTTAIVIYFYLNRKSSEDVTAIAGVYRQPGGLKYWFKVAFFFGLMSIRKWKDQRDASTTPRDHTSLENYNSGYGTRSKVDPEDMDKAQELSSHFQAIDAIYFNGAETQEDGFYFVSGTARRPKGVINGFLIFRVPGLGTLVSKKFPDSLLFGTPDGQGSQGWLAEGFHYRVVKPMKHWELTFDGEMKNYYKNDGKLHRVSLRADWTSNLEYFDYDTMIPPWTMARSIAKEPWSRQYFNTLKEAHQTHYEQHGQVKGQIIVDGQAYPFEMPSMRDHSYGVKRNWKLLHRYIFHMFSTIGGRRFDVGLVSQPVTCSGLELGYMYDIDGTLLALESVDMPLEYLGEGGSPPQDYGFTVRTTDKRTWYIQVQVLDIQKLYIGWEWEAEIFERRCKFTVNGLDEGYGISEAYYRNSKVPRSDEAKSSDPDWVQKYDNSKEPLY